MAGQQELIIKLIILMMFLVGLGVAGYFGYKEYEKRCPDGFMVCLGFEDEPEPDTDEDEDVPSDMLNIPQSELYKTCGRYVVPQETRICKKTPGFQNGCRIRVK
jgi:hypothetical protein